VGKETIFKPTIGNESVHQDGNDNRLRIVNFATFDGERSNLRKLNKLEDRKL
jgi:hypothetical protein